MIVDPTDKAEIDDAISKDPYSLSMWLTLINLTNEDPWEERQAVFERAVSTLPGSYKLWRMYLSEFRKVTKGKAHNDPLVGSAIEAHERSFVFLNKMPRLWIEFSSYLMSFKFVTLTRRAFDLALRALPITQHHHIWRYYLEFANKPFVPPETAILIYRRRIKLQPELIEEFYEYLISNDMFDEAAVTLIKFLNDPYAISATGKTKAQLWLVLCDLIAQHPNEIHSVPDPDLLIREAISKFTDTQGKLWVSLANFFIRQAHFERARDVFEEGMKKVTTVQDFVLVFNECARMEEQLASAMISQGVPHRKKNRRAELSVKERTTFEDILNGVVPSDDEPQHAIKPLSSKEQQALALDRLEYLVGTRSLRLSDASLRQNPYAVGEWIKRAILIAEDKTPFIHDSIGVRQKRMFEDAIETIVPEQAVGRLSDVWIAYARVCEEREGEKDIPSAGSVFRRATKAHFRGGDEMASVWCEWIEMELRHRRYIPALELAREALSSAPSTTTKALHHKDNGVWKSLQLWTLYADLAESFSTLTECRMCYDRMMEYQIITPLVLLNYAALLQQNNYFEDSFGVYEKGIHLFPFPQSEEIWQSYLLQFVKRYGVKGHLERVREMFDELFTALPVRASFENSKRKGEEVSVDFVRKVYVMASQIEEEHGRINRAMVLLADCEKALVTLLYTQQSRFRGGRSKEKRVCTAKDILHIYVVHVARYSHFFGPTKTRPIFEEGIRQLMSLPAFVRALGEEKGEVTENGVELRDGVSCAIELVLQYAKMERTLGEIDRARSLYQQMARFANPDVIPAFWDDWKQFELRFGDTDTFKEMKRIQRTVQGSFSSSNFVQTNLLAAKGITEDEVAKKALSVATDLEQKELARRRRRDEQKGMKVPEKSTVSEGIAQLRQQQEETMLKDEPPKTASNQNDEEIDL
ncbi:putative Pre-mRNA-splicing factor SYF1 [Blattamonas nauphoetae]|uniref:Pre-mRNA-splicing factor SYF1 n=1 Tax=Blattamonas nauphoetae TaxID=2049346 RepID=A0ABQ9YFF0_9EUKA|nr:putative Pre-mRNA-splicing factor SYF1 [Blattamonas nauphoetae]